MVQIYTTPMKNLDLQEEVRVLALGIPVGSKSSHLMCPCCGGGASKERSFIVSRSHNVLFYKCYRNSCQWNGVIKSIASDGDVTERVHSERRPDPYPFNTRKLDKEEIEFLQNKYELSEDNIVLNRVKHNIPNDKYVFPITDIRGMEIGLLDRDFRDKRIKARNTWFDWKVPHLYFPKELHKNHSRRIFIVEDVVSAMKINQLDRVAVCALLGTSISDATMLYLASLTDSITLMLDPDAITTAMRYKKRYSLLFKQPIGVVQLQADPKDTPFKKLEEIIF